MTFIEILAVYAASICSSLIFVLFGFLPTLLYWHTDQAWFFALYLVIIPTMLLALAVLERKAINCGALKERSAEQ